MPSFVILTPALYLGSARGTHQKQYPTFAASSFLIFHRRMTIVVIVVRCTAETTLAHTRVGFHHGIRPTWVKHKIESSIQTMLLGCLVVGRFGCFGIVVVVFQIALNASMKLIDVNVFFWLPSLFGCNQRLNEFTGPVIVCCQS